MARTNSRTEIRRISCDVFSKHLRVPFNVSDDEIDLSNLPVSDSVKFNSLVRLAVERLNHPVTMIDLAEELKIHLLNLNDVENCSVKSIAYGRCKLIQNKINEIIPLLTELHNDKTLGNVINFDAEKLLHEVDEAQLKLNNWFDDNPNVLNSSLSKNVQDKVSGLTVEELWKLLQPLYPKAMKVKNVAEISNILSGDIRGFKNSNYKSSFCDGSLETAQYLFDKTDAFTYAGQKRGESECFMQATMVRDNLGLLRDVNFILPALSSTNYNERLIAVSCLAFLQDQNAIRHLFETCLNDLDAGVYESAIWAYAFIGGNVKTLDAEVRKSKINEKVLEFLAKLNAETLLNCGLFD